MTPATQQRTPNTTQRHTDDNHAVRPWTAWQDWVNVVLSAYLILAPLWTSGAPGGWFVTLGILGLAAALWALATSSSKVSEWTQIVIGAVVFLSPWLGGFATAAAAGWTAWIIGLGLIIFAVAGMTMNRPAETRPVHTTQSSRAKYLSKTMSHCGASFSLLNG